MFRFRSMVPAALLAFGCVAFVGCQPAPKTEEKKESLEDHAQTTFRDFQREDSSLKEFLDKADGYAVFPGVGKGGFIVGGGYGRGVVYEGGKQVGYADIKQVSAGLQIGGQTYSELIVFATRDAMQKFTGGEYALAGDVSAVALRAGAAAQANFKNGVAVFVRSGGGAFAGATVAGQKFDFTPSSEHMPMK